MKVAKARKEYTESQRMEILVREQKGESQNHIATTMNISRQGVSDFIRKAKARLSIKDLPRSGRPHKMEENWMRHIGVALKRGQLHDSRDVQQFILERFNAQVSMSAVKKYLTAHGYYPYKLRSKPLLKPHHRRARTKLCREWSKNGENFWRMVVFSDETSIHRVGGGRKNCQWLPKNHPFTAARLAPSASFGGGCRSAVGRHLLKGHTCMDIF